MPRYNRPYGLCVDQNGKTSINPREAEIVRAIFLSYLDGNSLGKLVDMLHEKSILSPSGAGRWSRASIDYILNTWMI